MDDGYKVDGRAHDGGGRSKVRADGRLGPRTHVTMDGGRLDDERGIGLFMALLVMVLLSAVAAAFMAGLNIETKIAGHDVRGSQALRIAEAGVSEAISRIRNSDIPNNMNPRMVAQIFLTEPGTVPVLGPDSIALATAQPDGAWLSYSTANKTDRVLTVKYRTNSARTLIYRYDPTKNPAVQTTSGNPIFQITSTGTKGFDRRRVVSEVIQKPFNVSAKAAVAANVDVKFTGDATVCGYNHRADTPTGIGENARNLVGGCNEDPGQQHWELGVAPSDKTGIWSTGDIQSGAGAQVDGTPAEQEGQVGFYAGPWEALGMSQGEFYSWLGPAVADPPMPPRGIIYLDNNTTLQDQTGDFSYDGGDGEGLLYVDGDLTLNSNFVYRGLIYVEGDLKLNGDAWILGGMIVRGRALLKNNGSAIVLYSYDAIVQNIVKYGGQMSTLSWIEER